MTDSTFFKSGEIIKSYHAPEPRLALKIQLRNGGSLRLNYQRTHQFISQISNSAVISPADYWKSAGTYLAPLINDQIALGFFKTPDKGNFELSAEAYYKNLQNLPEYKNGALLLMNPHLETDYIPAQGYSYGLELMARKSSGSLNGWMPPYHRMDVAITLDENLRRKRTWKGSWTFSVYNLYGRKNLYSVFYRKDASLQSMDKNKTQYSIYKLSIIGVPVPSITYNFKF